MIIISGEEKIEVFYFDGHKPDEDKFSRVTGFKTDVEKM